MQLSKQSSSSGKRSMTTVLRFLFVLLTVGSVASAADRPNIVFIMADDLGWADPGFHGGDGALTPNMDELATESTRFTQFYMTPVCATTRSALMTGRYSFREWMDWRSEDFGKPDYLEMLGMKLAHLPDGTPTRRILGLPTEERTVAEALRAARADSGTRAAPAATRAASVVVVVERSLACSGSIRATSMTYWSK